MNAIVWFDRLRNGFMCSQHKAHLTLSLDSEHAMKNKYHNSHHHVIIIQCTTIFVHTGHSLISLISVQ